MLATVSAAGWWLRGASTAGWPSARVGRPNTSERKAGGADWPTHMRSWEPFSTRNTPWGLATVRSEALGRRGGRLTSPVAGFWAPRGGRRSSSSGITRGQAAGTACSTPRYWSRMSAAARSSARTSASGRKAACFMRPSACKGRSRSGSERMRALERRASAGQTLRKPLIASRALACTSSRPSSSLPPRAFSAASFAVSEVTASTSTSLWSSATEATTGTQAVDTRMRRSPSEVV
mmetsp:Transcript_11878/g.40514  ORF Transcript_11878/g.40514 Transcript_11878/m.40514 type:complete len:235 (+) Transcript_11878:1279-1983(+)